MKTKEIMPLIYENLQIFYTMCLSSTLMSTYNSKSSDADCKEIITFIGKAFNLPQNTTEAFAECILGDMMYVGLITDYQATSSELLTDSDKENLELFEIKGRVIEEIAVCETTNYLCADMRMANQIKANMKYDFFHHPYNAKMRHFHLRKLAQNGNVSITRQLAILYALGIGCNKDTRKAEENFLKCILWGDRISAVLLDFLYYSTGKKHMDFSALYRIYDNPDTPIKHKTVSQYHNLIRLLRAFIIAPKKDNLINQELATILLSNNLTYKEKTELIVNFSESNYKTALLKDKKTESRIGFRVSKNE